MKKRNVEIIKGISIAYMITLFVILVLAITYTYTQLLLDMNAPTPILITCVKRIIIGVKSSHNCVYV